MLYITTLLYVKTLLYVITVSGQNATMSKTDKMPQCKWWNNLLHMCKRYCPRKVSPRVQSASSTHIHSRKKRKLGKQLEEAKIKANCPQARLILLEGKWP